MAIPALSIANKYLLFFVGVQHTVHIKNEIVDPKETPLGCSATQKPIDVDTIWKTNNRLRQLADEVHKHRNNIRVIMLFTNATPIRCQGRIGYACCFCYNQYPKAADLKKHTLEDHDNKLKLTFMAEKTMVSYLVKLDITDLTCKICNSKIDTLEQLTDHLIKNHGKKLFVDIKNHIMPFKFEEDDVLKCVSCANVFYRFKNLQQHMNVHYRNYVCDVCDAGFIYENGLIFHAKTHDVGVFKCDLCPKTYATDKRRRSHRYTHVNKPYKCVYCSETFSFRFHREKHVADFHGIPLKVIQCQACDKTFARVHSLNAHTKRFHMMEKLHKCTICDSEFSESHDLKRHMLNHTGLREFKCDVCLKSYGRRYTLKQHMRIHENDRRFKCEHCGQAFVQKCSWRGHMKNRHGETV